MYSMRRWSVRKARALDRLYGAFERVLIAGDPLFAWLGYERLERPVASVEQFIKGFFFDCRMCGQCVLHSTGMTCPMNCPKNLRNGPCGGVRQNGHCEVKPEMRCVWAQAWERSRHMPTYGHELFNVLPPVNRSLQGTSAWINDFTGAAQQNPAGWVAASDIQVVP